MFTANSTVRWDGVPVIMTVKRLASTSVVPLLKKQTLFPKMCILKFFIFIFYLVYSLMIYGYSRWHLMRRESGFLSLPLSKTAIELYSSMQTKLIWELAARSLNRQDKPEYSSAERLFQRMINLRSEWLANGFIRLGLPVRKRFASQKRL